MRLGRISQLTDKPATEFDGVAVRSLAQANLKREYSRGLEDGVVMALDHIEGKAGAGGALYSGPIPDELRAYLASVRKQLVA